MKRLLFLLLLIPSLAFADGTSGSAAEKDAWRQATGKTYLRVSANNVGIGTSTPSRKLDVNGDINVSGDAYFTDIYSIPGNLGIGLTNPSYNLDVVGTGRFTQGVNMATLGGNVGIGTTAPATAKLNIATGNSFAIGTTVWNSGDSIDGTKVANADLGDIGVATGVWSVEDDSHAHTGSTLSSIDISADTNLTAGDALTLTDDDIDFDGGATPGGELGNTWASPTIDDSLAVTSWTLTTPILSGIFNTDNNWLSGDGGAEGLMIDDAGNVGIGTTAPLANLQIGNVTAIQNVVNGQSMYGWNTYYDGANWKYIIAAKAAAMRFAALNNGDISFHTAGTGTAGGTVSNWDDTGIKMVIQNGGNVGIGTTDPSAARLVVTGASGAENAVVVNGASNANAGLNINSTLNGGDSVLMLSNSVDANNSWALERLNAGNFAIYHSDGTYPGGNLSARLVIDTNGNVGIGTTGPTRLLEVNGIAKATDFLGTIGATTASTGAFTTISSTTGANLCIASGNVGIGTTAPTNSLFVTKSIDGIQGMTLQNLNVGAAAQALILAQSDVSNLYIGAHSSIFSARPGVGFIDAQTNNDLDLMANDSIKMTIKAGGNVGVGTTAPSRLFEVAGITKATDFLGTIGATTATTGAFTTITGTSLTTTGNVGIGTTSIGVARIEIGGNASKIKMYSPDGTGYSCGVADGGVFSCS